MKTEQKYDLGFGTVKFKIKSVSDTLANIYQSNTKIGYARKTGERWAARFQCEGDNLTASSENLNDLFEGLSMYVCVRKIAKHNEDAYSKEMDPKNKLSGFFRPHNVDQDLWEIQRARTHQRKRAHAEDKLKELTARYGITVS